MKALLNLIIVGILIVGCSEKKEEQQTKETNQFSDIETQLSYNLEGGQKFNYLLTTYTSQNQDIKGDTVLTTKSSQTEKYTIETEITGAMDEGHIARVSVSGIGMTGGMNDQTISYKSGSDLSNEERLQFIDYESLLDTPFRIAFGRDGEITDVHGADKIIDNMIRLNGSGNRIPAEEKKKFSYELAGTALKPLCQQVFRRLPDTTVTLGSEWSDVYESALASFHVVNIASYTLKNIEVVNNDTLLVIDAALSADVEGENRLEQNESVYFFDDPRISGSGTIKFNITKGVVQESETIVRVEMFIRISTKDESGNPVEVLRNDLTINQYNVKLLN